MYKSIIYKVNKSSVKKAFGILAKIALAEFGMYSLFNISPFNDDLFELSRIRIDGEEEFVDKVSNKFEYFFKESKIGGKLERL